MIACPVGTRIFKCSKFWSRQNFVTRLWTMRKVFVNTWGQCERMHASEWQCTPCHDCHDLPWIVREQLMSSSGYVHKQFTTTARQWRWFLCVGIYRASWTLLTIPEIASKETTYITETTCCLQQSRQNGTTCHDKIVAKSRASVSFA